MPKPFSSAACAARKVLMIGAATACIACIPIECPRAGSPSSANTGALTLAGGVDAPSVYVLRGLVQERDPKVTLTPYGELGITLARGNDGDGRLRAPWRLEQPADRIVRLERLHRASAFFEKRLRRPVVRRHPLVPD